MTHDLVVIGLTVALVLSLVLYVFRTRGLREANEMLADSESEAFDRAVDAERRASAAETELGFLKQTVLQIVNRPGIVMLTEEQFTSLVQTIQQTVQASVRPNSIN